MSGPDLLLGLDVGTTRIKALLVERAGSSLDLAVADTPFTRQDGRTEMPVESLHEAVTGVLADLGPERARVAAVGIAGLAESGAPLAGDGRALGPVVAWHDPRGEEVVARLCDRFGDSLAARIGQPLRTVSSVAKLGWFLDQGVEGLHRWLGVPELCLSRLTGVAATEHSLAARTGCYDVRRRSWMPEVAGALGVPASVFPGVIAAGKPMGRVSAAGAAWSGLAEGVPVTIAGHDHLAGARGAGAGDADLANSVGTAETVVRHQAALPDVDRALALGVAVSVRPGGDGWAVLASAARSGIVLEAAAEALGHPPAALDDLAEGAIGTDVTAVVRAIEAGGDPEVAGEQPGDVWLGLLRALSARTWQAAERVVTLLGPAQRLVVFGGGSRSRVWTRTKAEAAPLPVVRMDDGDAVARGAAVFAGVAAGWWPGPEAAPSPRLEPAPGGGDATGR